MFQRCRCLTSAWRWLIWLPCLALPLLAVAASPGLRLGVSDTATAFPAYADFTPGKPPSGALIDFWACVLREETAPLEFVRRPLRRLRQELIHGEIDILLSSFKGPDQLRMVEQNGMDFSDAFQGVYVSLLVRTEDAQLLQAGLWQQQPIGVVKHSVLQGDPQRLGGSIGLRAKSAVQLLKQLISGRVDMIALPASWPGPASRDFGGVSLSGRTLLNRGVQGVVSRQRLQADPQLLLRINSRIPVCKGVMSALQLDLLRL